MTLIHGTRSGGATRRVILAALLSCSIGACDSTASPEPMGTGTAATGPASSSGPASTASTQPSTPASSSTGASDEIPVRIVLTGRGPIGMAIDGSTGWVVATDSGQLIELDLGASRERRAIDIGPGGSGVIVGADGTVFVGRYDTGSSGDGALVLRGPDRAVQGLASGPLGGLALGEAGTVWVLEKAGRVVELDPSSGLERVATEVTVDPNEHMDIVAGAGARWLSSDHTAVRRIAADGTIAAEIETGGGIPLAFSDGLVWGARGAELWGIDPRTNEVARHVALDRVDEILAMEVGDGAAWIAIRRPGRAGRLIGVSLADGRLLAEHEVGLPAAVELTSDRVWVTDYETSSVLGFTR